MNLYLADYHLEACRLCLAQRAEDERRGAKSEGREVQRAKEHFAIAKDMIEKIGYGRRKPDLEDLGGDLGKL
jgi:hypothetical protein